METNNLLAIKRIAVDKPAGTYFIVTDNSKVNPTAKTSNLRLFFINSQIGVVNTVVQFIKGDVQGFETVFGKQSRVLEKRGNFSHQVVLDALAVADVLVCNLRAFDSSLDKVNLIGMNANKIVQENVQNVPYTNLFNTNGFFTVSPKKMVNNFTGTHLLNFGNVGDKVVSTFVTVAKDISTLTGKGEQTLAETTIEFEAYPSLLASPKKLFKETFVDVYIFNVDFNPLTVSTNQFYGQLFNSSGLIDYENLEALSKIPEAGFNRKITGTVIPNVNNERNEAISIDTLMNLDYVESGVICYINDDVLEIEESVLYSDLVGYYDRTTGNLSTVGNYLSHRLQTATVDAQDMGAIIIRDIVNKDNVDLLTFSGDDTELFLDPSKRHKVLSIGENGIKVGDTIIGTVPSNVVTVLSIEVIELNCTDGITNPTANDHYTKVQLTLSGSIGNTVNGDKYTRQTNLLRKSKVLSSQLYNYVPRVAQFCNGSSSNQKSVLDVMNTPAIVRGCKSLSGLAYIVDVFKSFPEASYKVQYHQLFSELDEANVIVRGIMNEPTMEDLDNSINPSFSTLPNGIFEYKYLEFGGNKQTSTQFMSKPNLASEMAYYFVGRFDGRTERPNTGLISNLFIGKTYPWDSVANTTGYIDGVSGLGFTPDEKERKFMENFRMNPILQTDRGFTIYGNFTGQKEETSLTQITSSELLAYIKRGLYALSVDDNFLKGTYNEYLASEVSYKNFMQDLVNVEAVQPGFILKCNEENNTEVTQKLKLKNVYVEYTAVGVSEKTIFSLNLK